MKKNLLQRLIGKAESKGMFNWMSDEKYLKLIYWSRLGKKLDLKNPNTYNEKLQWLKLYDRKSEYTDMVDKYEVKEYVAEKIGGKYIIPTLGIWNNFDEINFDKLPDRFVLKCTHDSGGLVICKDKKTFDMEGARKKINKSLKRNYYQSGREWPYKNVKPRIIAEKYMEPKDGSDIKDYKYFCFEGVPRMILVCDNRFSETGLTEDFYDVDWNHLPVERVHHKNSKNNIPKPQNNDLMLSLAAKLSKGMHFMRVDFYEIDGEVYFGEITFFPASGCEGFVPDEWDLKLGEWLSLNGNSAKG